jgi:hypothetical protein
MSRWLPMRCHLRIIIRVGYSPLLRQSLLAGNKPLKEAKGRFKISIDALYNREQLYIYKILKFFQFILSFKTIL